MNESSRRGITIGASIAAVVVLLAGMGVFLASRVAVMTRSGRARRRAVRRASTSSTTTTTIVADSTTTTTTTPLDGGRQRRRRSRRRRRRGRSRSRPSGLTAGTPDEAVVWTQSSGPDVTRGVGNVHGTRRIVRCTGRREHGHLPARGHRGERGRDRRPDHPGVRRRRAIGVRRRRARQRRRRRHDGRART